MKRKLFFFAIRRLIKLISYRKVNVEKGMLRCLFYFILLWSATFHGQDDSTFNVNGKTVVKEEFSLAVNRMLVKTGIPGISIAVINRGKVVYANAYGYKRVINSKAVDRNTIFEACSLSKSFLVYVVNRMVDKNAFDLDKPLYEYLKYPPLEKDSRYKLITARMVLAHASGIENWKADNNPDSLEILAEPGTEYYYSGEGYQYLAKVIEHLLEEPYEDYISRMVTKPLNLNRTYVKFNSKGTYPTNYAIGHNVYGKEIEKFKNTVPIPASSINLTASDYAKLMIALFDGNKLSKDRINGILKPVIKEFKDNPYLYYGPGFEILRNEKDTLLLHGGDNWGFKGFVVYSVNSRSGLVFLANSDRGKYLITKLCEMTVGFDIEGYFTNDYRTQYPSTTYELLDEYINNGEDEMLNKIKGLTSKYDRKLEEKVLNELGRIFFFDEPNLARKLLNKNLELYPKSAFAYYLLAHLSLVEEDYGDAYQGFIMAKKLRYTNDPIDPYLEICNQESNK